MSFSVREAIVSVVVELIIGKGFETILTKCKQVQDKRKLKHEILEFAELQFDEVFSIADQNSEIDFQGLQGFILGDGAEQIIKLVTEQDFTRAEHLNDTIFHFAYSSASARTSDARCVVYTFMNAVISIIHDYYIQQNDPTALALHAGQTHMIMNAISASTDEMKQVAQTAILSLSTRESTFHFESDFDDSVVEGITRYIVPYENGTQDTFHFDFGDKQKNKLIEICLSKKHIVVLGEAGAGKTYAMKQLIGDANSNGYTPIFISLKYFPENDSLNKLLDPDIAIPDGHIFILDGFDEITPEHIHDFEKKINARKRKLATVNIVVTSRYNFYKAYTPESNTLEGFEIYTLLRISSKDREEYATQRGIDYQSFAKELYNKSLVDLSYNPFYFTQLIDIWDKDQSLPKRDSLMRVIIEKRIKDDIRKYSCHDLDEKTETAHQSLMEAAFVLQCLHSSEISDADYQNLFLLDERVILKHIGLWGKNSNNHWGFEHNNFREFFAAEFLQLMSFDKILTYITMPQDKSAIRVSWLNTLAFLILIRKQDDLLTWIRESNPSFVVRFETDRISPPERVSAFITIVDSYAINGTWLQDDAIPISEIAAFGECGESCQYLINQLQKPQTDRHLLNLLRILKEFVDLYGLREKALHALLSIIESKDSSPYVIMETIKVMASHSFYGQEQVQHLVDLYGFSSDVDTLAALYRYLISSKYGGEYTSVFIHGMGKASSSDHTNLSFVEGIRDGLLCAETLESLELILKAYHDYPQELHGKESTSVYQQCCARAAAKYHKTNVALIRLLSDSLFVFCEHGVDSGARAINDFIYQTHTEELFVDAITHSDNVNYRSLVFEDIMSVPFARVIAERYRQSESDFVEFMNWYPYRLIGNEEWFTIIDDAVLSITGNHIPKNENYQYHITAQEKHQHFFDSLFFPDVFDGIVQELLDIVGRDCTIDGLHHADPRIYRHADLNDCANALHSWFFGKPDLNIRDYRSFDWDLFSHQCMLAQICNHSVIATTQQTESIESWCNKHIEGKKAEDIAIEHGHERIYTPILIIVLKLMEKLNIAFCTGLLQTMLCIPDGFFQGKKNNGFPEYVVQNTTREQLNRQVIQNVQTLCLHGSVVGNHFEYCTDNKIRQAKELAIRIIHGDNENSYQKYRAMRYLYTTFGAECIYNNIVCNCHSTDMLVLITDIVPTNEYNNEIDSKVLKAYNEDEEDRVRWFRLLIMRNSKQAIDAYYQMAAEQMEIPKFKKGGIRDITEAIASVSDEARICDLNKLLALSCDERFKDLEYFGLRYNVLKAFESIAANHYLCVVTMLIDKKAISEEGSLLHTTIIDLIESIKSKHNVYSDMPLALSDARNEVLRTRYSQQQPSFEI